MCVCRVVLEPWMNFNFKSINQYRENKIYKIPLVLFGTEYYKGLIDWIKNTMIKEDTIVSDDLDIITVTDDIDEVISIMNAHREYKLKMIEEEKE